jgi:hypothetical protein
MNKEQQTDRIIRNKLRYHASATPDHLWDSIAAELPTDKKDRGGFWWWMGGGFLGLALLAGFGAFFLLGSDTDAASAKNKNTTSGQLNEMAAATIQDAAQLKEANEGNVLDLVSSTLPSSVSAANSLLATAKNKQNPAPAPAELKINKKINNTQATNTTEEVSILNETGATTKVVADTDIEKLDSKHFDKLDLASNTVVPLVAKEKELDWPSMLQAPKCATFGKWLKLSFYADAYVSPDVAFRQLNSKDAEYESYALNREATETQLLSMSMGARVSVVSNYGISLRTGLVYSQINERFNHEMDEVIQTWTELGTDINGNPINSDTTIERGTRYIKTYNRYKMVDVPLLLGYEVAFKKFSLSLNSGIYANLISRQKGEFLSPDLKPVTFSSDAINHYPAFRSRLNLSVYGSIAMYYNLNQHWQLMLEPQMRYYLDPLTVSNYMIEQKYTSVGLITGLRYRF